MKWSDIAASPRYDASLRRPKQPKDCYRLEVGSMDHCYCLHSFLTLDYAHGQTTRCLTWSCQADNVYHIHSFHPETLVAHRAKDQDFVDQLSSASHYSQAVS
jgi:hypothetical protein